MYIRRKVFSRINVEGEDRYFSTTEFINEDEYLRLFSEEEEVEEKKGMSGKKKAAIIGASSAAALAAAGVAGKKGLLGKKVEKGINERLVKAGKGLRSEGIVRSGSKDLHMDRSARKEYEKLMKESKKFKNPESSDVYNRAAQMKDKAERATQADVEKYVINPRNERKAAAKAAKEAKK